jgi:hypothetical protein
MKKILLAIVSLCLFTISFYSQPAELDQYNVIWTNQSKNSSESMPCGGGDIGLNVWVEDGNVLFYISRSGTFDENNGFLKLGRFRLKLTPNPLNGNDFKQELKLRDGNIIIEGSDKGIEAKICEWVDVFRPVIHIEVQSNKAIGIEAIYESWRTSDFKLRKAESFANSYKWAPIDSIYCYKDEIAFQNDGILFYHKNRPKSVFDITVTQQGLDSVKESLFNPLKNLIFGGVITGNNLQTDGTTIEKYIDTDYKGWKLKSKTPSKNHTIAITLHTSKTENIDDWQNGLNHTLDEAKKQGKTAQVKTIEWWNNYWQRSYVFIHPDKKWYDSAAWQVGRNYQLFRYLLGCNAYGTYPTKFNGGLFTVDPGFTDSTRRFTPDFRNWGGGTFTAQNQRLVYFPMLKNGDFDMMKPQFDFYLGILKNAELRSEVYWGHKGACFTEQMENFGLPNCSEYGWKRPDYFDKGVEYNAWLEYEWDTSLEFSFMILESERYTGQDISEYISLIESCLTFFNEHYQYFAKHRGRKALDEQGHLILYPGSAGETYKMAYNASSTVAALNTVLTRLLELPEKYLNEEKRKEWATMLSRIPPINFRECNGYPTIAPAKLWERVNNTESMQLYPVYPWGIYGVGKRGLDTAINTWKYDPDAVKFRSHIGWKQDNIFAARLGLTEEAAKLTELKLKDSGRRFPAFWGPGFDWVPDHNWGGSGMIGLQEMLMQTDGQKIILFPAWPKSWDVHFKLCAPYNTTVEGVVKNGKVEMLKVIPESRSKDVVNMF